MNRNKILLAIALILNLFILACLQYFILVNHMLDNKIIYPGDFDSREFNFFIAWIWPVVLILWYKLKKNA